MVRRIGGANGARGPRNRKSPRHTLFAYMIVLRHNSQAHAVIAGGAKIRLYRVPGIADGSAP
jgi:hypothetical protein